MVKRLFFLAIVVLALAAVPVAFGDDGSNPAAGNARQRLEKIGDRVHQAEARFAKRCGTSAGGAPQRCIDFANNALKKLQALDARIQAQLTKLQACTATSTDRYCTNADKKIALLQQIDQRVQALEQKIQAWLNGTSSSSSSTGSSTSDSGLDQAAAGLGQLTKQVGGATP